jgi:hypothetical protein
MADTVDRLRRGEHSSRLSWLVLAVAMPISAALALWYGRFTWFSVDELAWITQSPGIGIGGLFDEHVGHLVAVPRAVYKVAFELIGPDYVTFRLLTTASVLLTGVLFFIWARRRIPEFVALAGCLVVLFFPWDPLHFIAGNGFTIVFALACGLAALIAWDRGDRIGDIAAFLLLMLGVATYTVALPFAIGLVVSALLERSGRRRIWVGLTPLVLYLIWRVVAGVGGSDPTSGGADWGNLVLVPAWTFQGLGALFNAWSGLGFDFSVGGAPPAGAGTGPGTVIAVLALIALGWRISRGGNRTAFWAALAIAGALYTAQTLGWGAILRGPELPRYLYPGLIVVLLVIVEAIRGLNWSRGSFVALWVVTAVSLLSAYGFLREISEWAEIRSKQSRAEVTAVNLLYRTGEAPPIRQQPRNKLSDEFRPGPAATYGLLGYEPWSLKERSPWVGDIVDFFLFRSLGIGLQPVPDSVPLRNCRTAIDTGPRYRLSLPYDGAILKSSTVAELRLGRYGYGTKIRLGTIAPGQNQRLKLYPDDAAARWFVVSNQPGLVGCTLPNRGG